jgi:hypothetical protein
VARDRAQAEVDRGHGLGRHHVDLDELVDEDALVELVDEDALVELVDEDALVEDDALVEEAPPVPPVPPEPLVLLDEAPPAPPPFDVVPLLVAVEAPVVNDDEPGAPPPPPPCNVQLAASPTSRSAAPDGKSGAR